MKHCDVREATYVQTMDGQWHRIKEKYGIGPEGGLAKPSEGGFGCRTEDGLDVHMTVAKLYGREESAMELKRPFQIDDGQLDGLSPQQIFVLGYELSTIDGILERNEPTRIVVHSANKDRIEAFAKTLNVSWRLTWIPADQSEDWMTLEIK